MSNSPISKVKDHYEVIVIGGGIVGAGILRDLSLNDIGTLLIDKKDFASQTSSKSSKMLHGGVRYLENMDFELVFEALHEKNLWLKLAPHLCYDSNFYLPVYKDSLRPMWMIRAGLFLYDLLSSFQNIPYKMSSKEELLKVIPDINPEGLTGAGVYHDAIVDDARLTIEVILDALNSKICDALNHTALDDFTFKDGHIEIEISDELTGEKKTLTCKELVLATGPFTDEILKNREDINWKTKLLASKGSHIWLKEDAINIKAPMLLTPKDGRIIFVIPQKGHILVGTTEIEHHGEKFDLVPSVEEVNYLLENLGEFFPKSKVEKSDIIGKFAGLRPLIMEESSNERGKTARNHKYYQPRHNLHVMMGGKYTTFRVMAQEITRNICNKLNRPYCSNKTKSPFKLKYKYLPFSNEPISKELEQNIRNYELVRTEQDYLRRIGELK